MLLNFLGFYTGTRYNQIHYLSSMSCEPWSYQDISKMACPHDIVLLSKAGNLFIIYEVPKKVILEHITKEAKKLLKQ